MERLFQFLYRYRALLVFLILQYLALTIIRNRTVYQQNQINRIGLEIAGFSNDLSQGIISYFLLKDENLKLQEENARLRDLLSKRTISPNTGTISDRPPSILQQYYYIPAEVINNTTNSFNNFITLNKGAIHGVERDMAVIGGKGIVGKIDAVSANYSTVISILHTGYYVSAKISPGNIQCTMKWDGARSKESKVLFVPRHLKVNVGDTVMTSGFNAIFPKEIPVGKISNVSLDDDASFYDLTIELFTNFNSINSVYVVGNRQRNEMIELEKGGIDD